MLNKINGWELDTLSLKVIWNTQLTSISMVRVFDQFYYTLEYNRCYICFVQQAFIIFSCDVIELHTPRRGPNYCCGFTQMVYWYSGAIWYKSSDNIYFRACSMHLRAINTNKPTLHWFLSNNKLTFEPPTQGPLLFFFSHVCDVFICWWVRMFSDRIFVDWCCFHISRCTNLCEIDHSITINNYDCGICDSYGVPVNLSIFQNIFESFIS